MDSETNEFASADNAGGARRYLATLFPPAEERDSWAQAVASGAAEGLLDWGAVNQQLQVLTARRKKPVELKYAAWQVELCPTTGKLHAHAALAFNEPVLYTQLQQLDALRALGNDYRKSFKFDRVEPDYPEGKSAVNYATKPASRVAGPFEWGSMAGLGQGARTDLSAVIETVRAAAKRGESSRSILKRAAEEHPDQFIKHARGIQDWVEATAAKEPFPTLDEIILLIGPPNAGKSRYARKTYPNAYTRSYPKNNQVYYCGYDFQEAIVYEEFVGGMQLQQFKKLADPGAPNMVGSEARFTLPRSASTIMGGGGLPFGSRQLVFISNTLPTKWWDLEKLDEDPFVVQRRFTKIIWFGGGRDDNDPRWAREFVGADRKLFWSFCDEAPLSKKLLWQMAKNKFYKETPEFQAASAALIA